MPRPEPTPVHPRPGSAFAQEVAEATIRFAGDAGDGMQLAGVRFTAASAACGNDVSTLPSLPAEIRAPAGCLAGVSGFQVHIGSHEIHTPGDVLNTLVAMNPAALRANLPDLETGGLLIVNADAFTPDELEKAGYATSPLTDGSLSAYRLVAVPIGTRTRDALARANLTVREADRCKNFFALGLVCCLYQRPLEPTLAWVRDKFAKNPAAIDANSRALKAGHSFGEKTEALPQRYAIGKAVLPAGRYRQVTGNEATALGLLTAGRLANLPLVFAAAPAPPATDLLHRLCELRSYGVRAAQAEDEAAALGMALGAAFGGALAATALSGPGLSRAAETLGLAVMTELPLIVLDVQRAGPSTGLPTKTEQADLLQALFGRHGECPLPVLAPSSPADCFATVIDAARLAIRYRTPVLILSDGHLACSAKSWKLPKLDELPAIEPHQQTAPQNGQPFLPFGRDEKLARPWAVPGTPGLEHRVGGLEKEDQTGDVNYEPLNHEWMVQTPARKIAGIAAELPPLTVDGPDAGDLLVLGWGSTSGAIRSAVRRARRKGQAVAAAHLRHLNPLPPNTGDVLRRYRNVLVPELNSGQLRLLLRATYLVDVIGLSKVQGRPFLVGEIEQKIDVMLAMPYEASG